MECQSNALRFILLLENSKLKNAFREKYIILCILKVVLTITEAALSSDTSEQLFGFVNPKATTVEISV